jgi:5'-nucleotidase
VCRSGKCNKGDLLACNSDADCASSIGNEYVCACPDAVAPTTDDATAQITCGSNAACGGGNGRCVLGSCRDDVAQFHSDEQCLGATGDVLHNCRVGACSQAGEQCKVLACLDDKVGALVDGRLQMLGR